MNRHEKHEPDERGDGHEREPEGSARTVERRHHPRAEETSEGAPPARSRSPISWLEKPADWI